MSPSMLNTPSVITRIVRSASAARISRSVARSASISPCGKILRSAFVSRMPSMMLAWFSSSLTIVAALGGEDRDDAGVAGEAGLEGEDGLDVLEHGQPCLELLVEAHRAGDGADRPGSGPESLDRVHGRAP